MALDPKADIRAYLLTLNALTQLVATRIRPDQRDEADGLDDCVVIEIDSGEQFNDLAGDGGLVQLDVMFRCISRTALGAAAIGEAIRTNGTSPGSGLDGYEGSAGSGYLQATRQRWSELAVFNVSIRAPVRGRWPRL